MERTNFEKLRVYKLSEDLADRIWDIVLKWEYLAKDTVGKQMIRAADGIGANIAEGTGRGSLEDNRRFIRMARGSLYETQHWLRRAYKRALLNKHQVSDLKPIIRAITDIECLSSLCKPGCCQLPKAKYKAQSTKF